MAIRFLSDNHLLWRVFLKATAPPVIETRTQHRARLKAQFGGSKRHLGPIQGNPQAGSRRRAEQDPSSAAPKLSDLRSGHLAVLGLDRTAKRNQIHETYRALAKRHHPNLQRNIDAKARANEEMLQINEAYDWLSANPKRF